MNKGATRTSVLCLYKLGCLRPSAGYPESLYWRSSPQAYFRIHPRGCPALLAKADKIRYFHIFLISFLLMLVSYSSFVWAENVSANKTQQEERLKRWRDLTPQQKKIFKERLKKWRKLDPKRRAEILKNFKRYKKLPPHQRQRIRENWQRWRKLPPQKRRKIQTLHRHWRRLSPQQRINLRKRLHRIREGAPKPGLKIKPKRPTGKLKSVPEPKIPPSGLKGKHHLRKDIIGDRKETINQHKKYIQHKRENIRGKAKDLKPLKKHPKPGFKHNLKDKKNERPFYQPRSPERQFRPRLRYRREFPHPLKPGLRKHKKKYSPRRGKPDLRYRRGGIRREQHNMPLRRNRRGIHRGGGQRRIRRR